MRPGRVASEPIRRGPVHQTPHAAVPQPRAADALVGVRERQAPVRVAADAGGLEPGVLEGLDHLVLVHVAHRLDPLDLHLIELLDEGEHGVQLALEVIDFVLSHSDAGKVRNAAYGIGVDSH